MTVPYMAFHGLILTASPSIVEEDGAALSGGGIKVDQTTGPDQAAAALYHTGRDMATYAFSVSSPARSIIEELVAEVNEAPQDVEFYPFDAERRTIAQYAHATRPQVMPYMGGTAQYYYSNVEIYCRSDALYGPSRGIGFARNVNLPQAVALINEGAGKETIEYLLASGAYDVTDGYTADFSMLLGYETVLLCQKLMRDDRFQLDRYGNVEHSYTTEFGKIYSALQVDLHGSEHVDYGTGGSCNYRSFILGNNAKLMIPFYGPLQISSDRPPSLEVVVESIEGEPDISVAYDSSLSDLADLDAEPLVLGHNFIEFPDCPGHSYVAIGLTTDSSSTVEISSLGAICRRYVPELPYIEPGDAFVMQAGDGEWSNHILNYLAMYYCDNF